VNQAVPYVKVERRVRRGARDSAGCAKHACFIARTPRERYFPMVLSILFAASILTHLDDSTVSGKLAIPKGWRTEDTNYPPPWAKDLPWKGELQIRFPPGWFQADSPEFWSYPVLYRLEGDVLSRRDELENALRGYDGGLYGGQFAASKIGIKIEPDTKGEKLGHAVLRRSIIIDGYDPFATRKALKTNLEVWRWYCQESKRTIVLILRSPRAFKEDDKVWVELLKVRDQFECHKAASP
jgi:hypothetical protein